MTNDDAHKLTKNERREAAREKARKLREDQKKRERRNRFLLQGGIVVGVLAVLAIVVLVIVQATRPTGAGPANMASDGVVFGAGMEVQKTPPLQPGQAPTPTTPNSSPSVANIVIYQDYICPVCGLFERTNSAQIEQMVSSGAATVEYHPLALFTNRSAGTKYSLRAANAAGCVVNYSPETFPAFNEAMFNPQPEEGTPALSNDEIKQRAHDAGVGSADAVDSCIDNGSFQGWAQAASDRALAGPLPNTSVEKVTGTPLVLVNGKQYTGSWTDASQFAAFVLQTTNQNYQGGTSQ